MNINRYNNRIEFKNNNKELFIEKSENNILISFFNSKINDNNDKAFKIDVSDGYVYECINTFFESLVSEYNKYKEYFKKIFLDKLYNDKYNSFVFYSNNYSKNNKQFIRIFKRNNEIYIYFNKPSSDFVIAEQSNNYNYNSFYKYFEMLYENLYNEKYDNKKYLKINNFKWEEK